MRTDEDIGETSRRGWTFLLSDDGKRRDSGGSCHNGKDRSGFPPAAVAEAPSGIAAMSVKHERRHQALIFCGKGNNGGDGFVVARKMSESGFCVHVILVDGQPVTEDSVTNFRLLENMPVQVTDMTENERVLMYMRVWPDIIVDAIYGTGFHGSLSGNALRAAIYMNKFKIGKVLKAAPISNRPGLLRLTPQDR